MERPRAPLEGDCMRSVKPVGVTTLAFLLLAGCATTHRGSVVMKVEGQEAHVGMGKGEVNVGDHVVLYKNRCSGNKDARTCEKLEGGHGAVTRVLNDHYSVVRFEDGVVYAEGDTVERHGH